MFSKLFNGDIITLLPNLKKDGTYGEMITPISMFWSEPFSRLNNHQGYKRIIDDGDMLDKIFWKYRKVTDKSSIRIFKRYYAYALKNGKYCIIQFNRTIFDLLDINRKNEYIRIRIEMKGNFPSYDLSYYNGDKLDFEITEDFLKDKPMYLEEHIEEHNWKNNIDVLKDDLGEHKYIIGDIINETRIKKLERILK